MSSVIVLRLILDGYASSADKRTKASWTLLCILLHCQISMFSRVIAIIDITYALKTVYSPSNNILIRNPATLDHRLSICVILHHGERSLLQVQTITLLLKDIHKVSIYSFNHRCLQFSLSPSDTITKQDMLILNAAYTSLGDNLYTDVFLFAVVRIEDVSNIYLYTFFSYSVT